MGGGGGGVVVCVCVGGGGGWGGGVRILGDGGGGGGGALIMKRVFLFVLCTETSGLGYEAFLADLCQLKGRQQRQLTAQI